MQRQQHIIQWLKGLYPTEIFTLAPASADASFRRYFRASFSNRSLIVMDAPPQQENCQLFLQIGRMFSATGVSVPQVIAQDLAQGFLLLSDFGSTTYLQALTPANAQQLYGDATDALLQLQRAPQSEELPPYDEALLRREMALFPEWYINKHLGVTLTDKQNSKLNQVVNFVVANNLAQPSVTVHRDYHARNLMLLETGNPGILDFQDAVFGPITYDLVSLFKDAYIHWEEAQIIDWLIRYWEKARKAGLPVCADFGEFYRDFELMGVQRHLKILGIFARLYHRDGKENYLKDMPLVLSYLRRACARYLDLKPLHVILLEIAPEDVSVGYTF